MKTRGSGDMRTILHIRDAKHLGAPEKRSVNTN
jgi:hypothetical protein